MAKILNKIHTERVGDIFPTTVGAVTIELTGEEAVVLSYLLCSVSGSRETSPRKICTGINDELSSVDGLREELARFEEEYSEIGDLHFND